MKNKVILDEMNKAPSRHFQTTQSRPLMIDQDINENKKCRYESRSRYDNLREPS